MFSKPLDLRLRTFAQRNCSTERAIPPQAVEFTNSAIETFLLSSSTKVFGSLFREMEGDARFETAVDRGKRRLGAPVIPTVGLFVKRIMDLLVSSVALVLLCPFLFVIALVIKLESPGPVIYASWRAGKRGKKFACYKFRTMVNGADGLKNSLRRFNERQDPFFKIADDPRVTRVGRFLRKYSLDELPQFWNALKGDMSLVGPRPHPLDDYARYRSEDHKRLEVKPGITGLWQVTARVDPSFETCMVLDLGYMKHWSPWLDCKILMRTIPAVLAGEGS